MNKLIEALVGLSILFLLIATAGLIEEAPALSFVCLMLMAVISYMSKDLWIDLEEEEDF